ncbi:FAD-dependent monooxygenase [Moraxella lincolnii]|uniref:FAD-dependent monooxygenase n=1 Tax=Lwoffella lincolnii TaxID=90241 RepID=UPI000991F196|nr:FAD-dependent monooxygenase [Moraxella lincolnii]
MSIQATNDTTDDNSTQNNRLSTQTVLIIGGGNVGLSFALLLADKGIHSTVLEKNTYPSISPDEDLDREQFDSRNMALSRRTVQIYQSITLHGHKKHGHKNGHKLWDDLQSHACRIDEVKISEQGSFGKATLDKHAEGVESFGQVMENAWLSKKLLLAVQANPHITLLDGATLTDIEQTPKEVTIHFHRHNNPNHNNPNHNNSNQTLTADLLVACDGQHSPSRKLLGIGTTSHDYHQVGIVGVVMTDKPHNHQAIERFTSAGLVAVLPLTDANGDGRERQQGHRRSVVWVCPTGEEQRYLADEQYFLDAIQASFGSRAGKFIKAGKRGAYPLVKVLADSQVKGRCVIMGNAAHTLHPVAGQGFNLCLRDADTLAKMIHQQIMRGGDIADSHMLSAYEKRRKADQKRVEWFCDAVVYGFTVKNPALKLARNVALIAFDKVPFIKPMVATFAMGLKS